MLVDHRNKKATLLCLVFSVETGEKAEKEPETKETEKPQQPKKSATKKEKKPRGAEGFQIWTELETQRNKFMVTVNGVYFTSVFSDIIWISLFIYELTEKYSSLL